VSSIAAACPSCGRTFGTRPPPKPLTQGDIEVGVFFGLLLWTVVAVVLTVAGLRYFVA
jgi:hypothetical protein